MLFSARTGLQFAAPVAAVLLSSCALPPSSAPRLAPPRSFTQYSELQIAAVHPVTAYDAVERLRPTALNPAGGSSFMPTVYLDGLRLGGPEALSHISAIDIVEIRFLTPIEASAQFGPTQRAGGAILLKSRLGVRQHIEY
ncbi:MAG TPA: hypothetical protein VJ852_08970 [Gemmatimonadaceae bacterium]|nr:hypothetical protein [Gemmatimonadaceae bacterium]